MMRVTTEVKSKAITADTREERFEEHPMKQEYDLFEKFPDGSSLWRNSVCGLGTTRVRLWELAQRSENHFYAINLTTGEVLAFDSEHDAPGFRAPSKAETRSKSQAA